MRLVRRAPDRLDVWHVGLVGWVLSVGVAFIAARLAFDAGSVVPLLVGSPLLGSLPFLQRSRRWRFDRTMGEVRFSRGILPWTQEAHALAAIPAGARLDHVPFAELVGAVLDGRGGAGSVGIYALALQLRDGRVIGFGGGYEVIDGQDASSETRANAIVDVINAFLRETPRMRPTVSLNAESFEGSLAAVPAFADRH